MDGVMQETDSIKWSVISTILYGFCSGSMNFLNKFILSVWSFHEPATIMFSQLVFLAIGLHLLKKSGKLKLEHYNLERAKTFIPLTLIYSFNSIMSLSALTGMNIPMYNAIRRCVPIASLLLGICMLQKQKTTLNIVLSIVTITAGTFVAAAGDMDFDMKAYLYGMTSVLSQALYLTTLQRLEMDHGIGALSISYINSINCVPLMALVAVFNGEFKSVIAFPAWNQPAFLIAFIALVFYGCIFTYSMFLCTTVNSALTTSLVGVAKSAITTTVGMYAFGGVAATKMMVLGQVINLAGATLYAYEKYKLSLLKKGHLMSVASTHKLELGHDLQSDSDLIKLAKINGNAIQIRVE